MTTREILEQAKNAKLAINAADTETKNLALSAMADHLYSDRKLILAANAEDMEKARGTISEVMLDRLLLTEERIAGMAEGIRALLSLHDPVGQVLASITRPNGMVIEKTAIPLGVIAIIYESRPNVTSDAAALCIKSGNACVLRSGKEAWKSARAIVDALQKGLQEAGLPAETISLVEDTARASAVELMKAVGYIDLLIPRGGAGLIQSCGSGQSSVHPDRNRNLSPLCR